MVLSISEARSDSIPESFIFASVSASGIISDISGRAYTTVHFVGEEKKASADLGADKDWRPTRVATWGLIEL